MFLVQAVNDPSRAAERKTARIAHLEFLRDSRHVITFGATATDLDDRNVGPILVVDVVDGAAAEAFMKRDPYYSYYASIKILKLALRIPEPAPGYFAEQIAAERTASVPARL